MAFFSQFGLSGLVILATLITVLLYRLQAKPESRPAAAVTFVVLARIGIPLIVEDIGDGHVHGVEELLGFFVFRNVLLIAFGPNRSRKADQKTENEGGTHYFFPPTISSICFSTSAGACHSFPALPVRSLPFSSIKTR